MPITLTDRFKIGQDLNGVELALSSPQFERLRGQEWLAEEDESKLVAVRGIPELEGMLAYYQRKLGGEISAGPSRIGSPEITAIKRKIREIKGELRERRAGNSATIPKPPTRRRRSPGRPRKVHPSLRIRDNEARFRDSSDTGGKEHE